MRIAITGGTGFIGKHLAQRLAVDGHEVVLLARGKERGEEIAGGMPMMTYVPSDLADQRVLAEAFVGCHSVAHCAGINRELGNQTFHKYMSKRQRMSSKLPNMPELCRYLI